MERDGGVTCQAVGVAEIVDALHFEQDDIEPGDGQRPIIKREKDRLRDRLRLRITDGTGPNVDLRINFDAVDAARLVRKDLTIPQRDIRERRPGRRRVINATAYNSRKRARRLEGRDQSSLQFQ